MDEAPFDALARGLASPHSRRRLLTRLAALPVVGGSAPSGNAHQA